jgi:hypothetical protein
MMISIVTGHVSKCVFKKALCDIDGIEVNINVKEWNRNISEYINKRQSGQAG